MDVGNVTPKRAYFRIVQTGHGWHVTRPNASLSHGFNSLDDAVAFVRNDDRTATVVEIVAGGVYMVKRID